MVLPHGKGVWTFADGTVFEGNNVAFYGFPHGRGDGDITYFAGRRADCDMDFDKFTCLLDEGTLFVDSE